MYCFISSPNGEECEICQTEWMSRKPVVLSCKHIFCRRCLDEHLQRNRTCPVCRKSVPEKFQPPANDQLMYGLFYCVKERNFFVTAFKCLYSVAGETYRSFRRCSTAFFMELISVHSFSESASQPPEQELVRMLMELVVQGPLSTGPLSTRPFSPFNEDAIDPRPVVRSFILQLLLKYK